MTGQPSFWSALAPYHAAIENSYLDLSSLRRILPDLRPPVLVVGAGQGLLVADLRRRGFRCDGVDLNLEMIRFARARRGLELVHADASAMPFAAGTYHSVILATGVVDFTPEDTKIQAILAEARRVATAGGPIFVAFYRISDSSRDFLIRLGLLDRDVLRHRDALELHRLTPLSVIAWIARRAGVGYTQAAVLALRAWMGSTWQEKRNAFHLQRIFGVESRAAALVGAAHDEQPYRDRAGIERLFERLATPLEQLDTLDSCYIARI